MMDGLGELGEWWMDRVSAILQLHEQKEVDEIRGRGSSSPFPWKAMDGRAPALSSRIISERFEQHIQVLQRPMQLNLEKKGFIGNEGTIPEWLTSTQHGVSLIFVLA
jgi:hypothetical protein